MTTVDPQSEQNAVRNRASRHRSRRTHFPAKVVRDHIRAHHPGCPGSVRKDLVWRVVARRWDAQSLGQIVGIVMDSYVRHELTDYDRLLASGLERDEARRKVQGEVLAIVRSWASPATHYI